MTVGWVKIGKLKIKRTPKRNPKGKLPSVPCARCGKPAYFNVGWLHPMRHDASSATTDTRPACSAACAARLATEQPWGKRNPRKLGPSDPIKVGSIVRYRQDFLRSTGMYTGPIPFARGRVTRIEPFGGGLATIAWDKPGVPDRVLVANLIRVGDLEPNPTLWSVTATRNGQQVPTFLLNGDVQGIVSQKGAERVAEEIVGPGAHVGVARWRTIENPKRGRRNPSPSPLPGQTWRGVISGARVKIVSVGNGRVIFLDMDSGNREHATLAEFRATYKPGATRAPNPRSQRARAEQTFRRWHEFDPKRLVQVKGPPPRIPKMLVKLGDMVQIIYRSPKYDGQAKVYEHRTGRPHPVLATDPDGKHLYIVGGKVRVTADGLVG